MKRIISIIGSGFGGLAAGCRLASQGYQVSIFEKNSLAGGKAAGINIEGFWLDSAPTILRMPHLIQDIFSQAPVEIRSRLQLHRLDTHYRFYQAQGAAVFDICADKNWTVNNLQSISAEDARNYPGYLAQCQHFYQSSLKTQPQPQLVGLRKFLAQLNLNPISSGTLRQTLFQLNAKTFSHHDVQSAFSFYPLFFGQNPMNTPERTAMLHGIEQQWGLVYPIGGMRGLITLFQDYFMSLGGKLFLNTPVSQIMVKRDQIQGLRLDDGSFVQTDHVITNLSPYLTQISLLKDPSFKQPSKRAFGNSFMIFHFITIKLPSRERFVLHSVINPRNLRQTLEAIFRRKSLPDDPWLYIHIPGLVDDTLLPPELDAVMVICPVPNLSTMIQPETYILRYRNLITKALEKIIPSFRDLIIHEKITTPKNLLEDYSMEMGTNYQPAIKSPIANLFYVGESTWRGLGIIGALSSAEEITRTIGNEN